MQIGETSAELKKGGKHALARAITLVEDSPRFAGTLFESLGTRAPEAMRLGITGPPGVGKSTIISRLIPRILDDGYKLGVLLVDPTSPISGGAVLGDRIRLSEILKRNDVFVRSLASRGSLGGVSLATGAAIRLLEHWGADVVIVETVGMGQAGTDIAFLADVVFLTLSPGAGDAVQTMKSGILEVADAYIVNKADMPGIPSLIASLEADLVMEDGSSPVILTANALKGEGIEEVWQRFRELRDSKMTGDKGLEFRKMRTAGELKFVTELLLRDMMWNDAGLTRRADELISAICNGRVDIFGAALTLLEDAGLDSFE